MDAPRSRQLDPRAATPALVLFAATWVMCAAAIAAAEPNASDGRPPAPQAAVSTQPAASGTPGAPAAPLVLPNLRIDREARTIDILATVVTREADWLELLACTDGTREYEALLTVKARPSHIHLALLMIGLEPGHPIDFEWEGQQVRAIPPTGARVAVSILSPREIKPTPTEKDTAPSEAVAGEAKPERQATDDAPAAPALADSSARPTAEAEADWPAMDQLQPMSPGRWIRNQNTGEPLPDAIWLFTGSRMRDIPAEGEREARRLYEADLSGSVISLVNFGDDLLTRSTLTTNKTDDAAWQAVTENIPPAGTTVIIRLSPAPTPVTAPPAPAPASTPAP